jgi:membrane protease YdiL (CAAX protease family)
MSFTSSQEADHAQLQGPPGISNRRVDLGLVLLVGFAPLVLSGTYQLFVPIAGTAGTMNFRLCARLMQETATLVLFATLLRRQGRTLKDIGLGFHWLDLPRGLGLYVLSYISFVFVSATVRSVYHVWTGSQIQYRDPQVIFAGASHVLFILYFIAAPIFEETLVRGYLMTELIGFSCPVWLAAAASIILQTSYHLYYGVGGALTVAAGFVISAAYFAKSRNLMPIILSHFIWDLTATYINWHR